MLRRLTIALCLALVLTGCSGADNADTPNPSTTTPVATETSASTLPAEVATSSTPQEPKAMQAWTFALSPLTQPRVVGNVAVILASDVGRLFVAAFDLSDGGMLWRAPAAVSADPASVPLYFHTMKVRGKNAVVYFAPASVANGLSTRVVAADLRTGAPLASSGDLWVHSLVPCLDGNGLCGQAAASADGAYRAYRFGTDGQFVPDPSAGPDGAMVLEPSGLVELAGRPQRIGFLNKQGGLVWQAPAARYFGATGTPQAGWTFDAIRSTVAGSVELPPVAKGEPLDLGAYVSTGIDPQSGKVLWSEKHTQWGCGGRLPTQLLSNVPLRCRWTGMRVGGSRVSFEGLDITIEGVDPATGQTTWGFAMGADERFARASWTFAYAGGNEVLVRPEGQPVVLDLAEGTTRAPGEGEVFLCSDVPSKIDVPSAQRGEGALGPRLGEDVWFPCGAHGRRLPNATPTAALMADVATKAPGGLVVFSSRSRLEAVSVR